MSFFGVEYDDLFIRNPDGRFQRWIDGTSKVIRNQIRSIGYKTILVVILPIQS